MDFETAHRPVADLETQVRGVASDARATLDDIGAYYRRVPQSGEATHEAIVDLCSIGRMELTNFSDAIMRASGTWWTRIATCDTALQVLRRCVRAVDGMMADIEGLERLPDETLSETTTAVQIRLAYVELHNAVVGVDLPDSETIRPRLRCAGNCIARALGRTVAASMRVHDRYMMRVFQARIRDALLAPDNGDATVERLLRLWQDLTSFTSLLLDVSKREELRIHDRRFLTAALEQVGPMLSPLPCPPEVLDALRACAGRDLVLDQLVVNGCTIGDLRSALQRVLPSIASMPERPVATSSGTWSGLV